MNVLSQFQSEHSQYIHDVAYDFYGQRLATCSGEKIKIWEQDQNGQWSCHAHNEINNSHNGPILKLAWAHPEYGQVLASCSMDKTVKIHEEQIDPEKNVPQWKSPGSMADSMGSVQALEFSPRHHGLKLATCSQDGQVRIYESNDVLNLSVWVLWGQFTADPNFSTKTKKRTPCTCLSWNPSPFDGPIMAVGVGKVVQVWGYKLQKWVVMCELKGHESEVMGVAWAPDVGRQHHLIATACKDRKVRIYKLTSDSETGNYNIVDVAVLNQHEAAVWRVSWNITGTVLASTGDDGRCRLWKKKMTGEWMCIMVATGQHATNVVEHSNGEGEEKQEYFQLPATHSDYNNFSDPYKNNTQGSMSDTDSPSSDDSVNIPSVGKSHGNVSQKNSRPLQQSSNLHTGHFDATGNSIRSLLSSSTAPKKYSQQTNTAGRFSGSGNNDKYNGNKYNGGFTRHGSGGNPQEGANSDGSSEEVSSGSYN